jgi:hypothetical protein
MEGSAVFLIQNCKLQKQEVSRNVGEMSLPPDYYQRVCQKSYCFCSSQVFII